jgi:pimeloyl-ACP methyl ester carboxylesterase
MAALVREALAALELKEPALVGHDVGGQVVFAYLTSYPGELSRAAIMDVVIPGIPPWDDVVRNPHIWHFAFHAVPNLPETLVQGKQRTYFDYFFDTISARPETITDTARTAYVEAYADPAALRTGFEWYRAFPQDAKRNAAVMADPSQFSTPVLYLRGEREGGEFDRYLAGLREAGLFNVNGAIIPGSGHFAPEEAPDAVARSMTAFMR